MRRRMIACPKPILSKYPAIQPALSSEMKRAFVSFLLKGPLIVSMVTVSVQCEPPSVPQTFLLNAATSAEIGVNPAFEKWPYPL